jgi:hypothetical protein
VATVEVTAEAETAETAEEEDLEAGEETAEAEPAPYWMARFPTAIKTTSTNNMTTTEDNSTYVMSEDVNASTGFTVTYAAYNAVNQAFNSHTVWVQPMKKRCGVSFKSILKSKVSEALTRAHVPAPTDMCLPAEDTVMQSRFPYCKESITVKTG